MPAIVVGHESLGLVAAVAGVHFVCGVMEMPSSTKKASSTYSGGSSDLAICNDDTVWH